MSYVKFCTGTSRGVVRMSWRGLEMGILGRVLQKTLHHTSRLEMYGLPTVPSILSKRFPPYILGRATCFICDLIFA